MENNKNVYALIALVALVEFSVLFIAFKGGIGHAKKNNGTSEAVVTTSTHTVEESGINNAGVFTGANESVVSVNDLAVGNDISSVHQLNSEYFFDSSNIEDSYGNVYRTAYYFRARLEKPTEEKAFVKYVLDKKMKNYECTFFMDPKNSHNKVAFQIIGDGRILYDTGFIGLEDRAMSVNVDVTDVEILEICAYAYEAYGYGIPKGYMADTRIY